MDSENPDSNIPMFMNGAQNYFTRPVGGAQGQYSDWAMFDASYFNIKNVSFGLPPSTGYRHKKWDRGIARIFQRGKPCFLLG